MLLALETIMSNTAISTNQVMSNIPNRTTCEPVLCKAVKPSSTQRFPTPATCGDTQGTMQASTACYNQAERLQAADCDSHSRPKHILQTILVLLLQSHRQELTTTIIVTQMMTHDYNYSHNSND